MSGLSCCGSGKCNSFLPTALLLSLLFAPLLSCSDGESDRRSRLRADKQTSSTSVTIQTTLSFPEGNVVPAGPPPVSLPEIYIVAVSKDGTYADMNVVDSYTFDSTLNLPADEYIYYIFASNPDSSDAYYAKTESSIAEGQADTTIAFSMVSNSGDGLSEDTQASERSIVSSSSNVRYLLKKSLTVSPGKSSTVSFCAPANSEIVFTRHNMESGGALTEVSKVNRGNETCYQYSITAPSTPGVYAALIIISIDNGARVSTAAVAITINVNMKLTVNAVAEPSQAEVDEMVLFRCYLSTGSETAAIFAEYSWSGAVTAYSGELMASVQQTSFPTPGTYEAVCTVAQLAGVLGNATATVVVTEQKSSECVCTDQGAQLAGVSGCSSSQWPDANQCSGWYSAGGQKGVKYESGTTKCKYGCCIQLTCGN